MAVLLAWAAVFAAAAIAATSGWSARADRGILLALRQADHPGRTVLPGALESAARDISGLGNWLVLVGLSLSVFGYLLLAGRRADAWLVLGATASGWSLERLIKLLIARPRPQVVPHLAEVSTASFPSGHAMMSAVVYLTIWAVLSARGAPANTEPGPPIAESRDWGPPRPSGGGRSRRIYTGVLVSGLVVLIGLSRLVLGVHYPTDVLGGWSAGLAWVLCCRAIARRLTG